MNNVNLIGNTTADANLKYLQNNTAVATVTLAVPRKRKNANGERDTDFINLVIWGKSAENFSNWVKKGGKVAVTGELNTRHYENNEGKRVYVTEVKVDEWNNLTPRDKSQDNSFNGQSYDNNGGAFGQSTSVDINEMPDFPFDR